MSQELLNMLMGVLGTVLTAVVSGLVSWGFLLLRKWVNKKITDAEDAKKLNTILTILEDAVMEVSQTLVSPLKADGKFTEKAAKEAKEKCMNIVKNKLTPELKDFIANLYGDVETYLSGKIEALVYSKK